jgi:hypothetical protein
MVTVETPVADEPGAAAVWRGRVVSVWLSPTPPKKPFWERCAVVEDVDDESDLDDDDALDDRAEELEPLGSASAIPGLLAIAAPTPIATVRAPMRPMYFAQPAVIDALLRWAEAACRGSPALGSEFVGVTWPPLRIRQTSPGLPRMAHTIFT